MLAGEPDNRGKVPETAKRLRGVKKNAGEVAPASKNADTSGLPPVMMPLNQNISTNLLMPWLSW